MRAACRAHTRKGFRPVFPLGTERNAPRTPLGYRFKLVAEKATPCNVPSPSGLANNARELDLLQGIIERDRAAFTELHRSYDGRLARFLSRIIPQHDVQEVVNDTMFAVWSKAADFRGQSLLSTWIFGIAYRMALKALRRRSPILTSDAEELWVEPDPQIANEDRQWLARALQELSFEQRSVLELCYLMGYSCEEIATIMQCPVNTVKTRMFHAREKLRQALPRLARPTEV
jgi:RNA polymerase sigma-70 factor, ECF subfamily